MLTTQTFAELVEPHQLGRITNSLTRTIELSFVQDKSSMTQNEVRRRFEICIRLFKQLRGDHHWGVQRILDRIPEYLRCELDGKSWEPDSRGMWLPGDG